jgi:hypothetical protein
MNAFARLSKEVVRASARGFAAAAYPERKVAVLGAAGGPGVKQYAVNIIIIVGEG